jgi:hypothetical protein
MKKRFLPFVLLLILGLIACGGDVDPEAIIEDVANTAEEVVDTASDAISDATSASTEDAEEPVSEGESTQLTVADVIGSYTFHTPSNDWHYVEIVQDGDMLLWANRAGREWTLTPDFENGLLLTDDSFPYQGQFQNYEIIMEGGGFAGLVSNDDLWVYNGPVAAAPAAGPADRWAGITADMAMAALSGANISINGVEAQSDGSGNFELYVPRAEDGRYLINADLDGFVPVSQIHIGSAMESLTLEFQPVHTETFDPAVGVEAVDDSGTQISIGANQLEDADGNEPSGDVTLSMYTYDLENEEMVGDMSGMNDQGDAVTMESAGAFYASFEDEDGTELNLKDGETAEVSVPVVEERPDEVLTVWSYDEETGLWIEESVATMEDGRYVAEVSHFSYWNFDWEKRTPSCIKLEVEASYLAANNPLNVRAVLQTNPNRVRDLSITQETNVLINLPNNTDVQFFATGESTPFATISSGAAWGGVGIPAFPYDACQGVAEVADAPAPAPATLQGQVIDATTGSPLEGVQVCVLDQCVTTASDGNYTINDVPAGQNSLQATKDGYIPVDAQPFTVEAGQTVTETTALSPELAQDTSIRIVLTWDTVLSDLDAYLRTPSDATISYGNLGSLDSAPFAKLDIDNIDAPAQARIETVTIELQDGTYTYWVHNVYPGEGGYDVSNARVQVLNSSGVIQEFSPPTGQSGAYWQVFTMDGAGNITPINTVSNSAP